MRCRAKKADFPAVIRDINRVGLTALKKHIAERHPNAANVERNIRIIEYAYKQGIAEAAQLYGSTPSAVKDMIGRYWKYAREILEERQ